MTFKFAGLLAVAGAALLGLVAWLALDEPQLAASGGARPPLAGSVANFTPFDPPRPIEQAGFVDGEERALTLGDFEGRVLLVNFWASWCAPCKAEMPSLDRLEAEMGGEDFQVVAVSVDEGGLPAVDRFYSMLGLENLETYLDPTGKFANALKLTALPTTVLVDRDGRALGALVGPAEWDSPEAKALIRYYMERDGAGVVSPT